jgi:RNA polymerase sigma-70 factor, ECF subfamily
MLWRRRLTPSPLGLSARSQAPTRIFADFYDQMSPSVLRFFARQMDDGNAALDLTAETFSKAFEKRRDFRGANDKQAAAWLWAIAHNELARYQRSRSVELAAIERLGLERPSPSDEELRRIEQLTAIEDARERVREALRTLPPDQQEVIRLRFFDELSYPEIAQHLAVSYDVVRARTSRALRALRATEQLRDAIHALDL